MERGAVVEVRVGERDEVRDVARRELGLRARAGSRPGRARARSATGPAGSARQPSSASESANASSAHRIDDVPPHRQVTSPRAESPGTSQREKPAARNASRSSASPYRFDCHQRPISGRVSQLRRVMNSTSRPSARSARAQSASASAKRVARHVLEHRRGDDEVVVGPVGRQRRRARARRLGAVATPSIPRRASTRGSVRASPGSGRTRASPSAGARAVERAEQRERDRTGAAARVQRCAAPPQRRIAQRRTRAVPAGSAPRG